MSINKIKNWIQALQLFYKKYGIKRSFFLLQSHYEYGGFKRILSIARRFVTANILLRSGAEYHSHVESQNVSHFVQNEVSAKDSAFQLSDDYSMPIYKWDQYLKSVISEVEEFEKQSITNSLVVAVDCSKLTSSHKSKFNHTQDSINNMISQTGESVSVVWFGDDKSAIKGLLDKFEQTICSTKELVATLDHDKYYLFIKLGDVIVDRAGLNIFSSIETEAECLLVDMFYTDHDKVFPFFWGKFDKILAESGSYYLDRLIVKGTLLKSSMKKNSHFSYDLIRGYLIDNDVVISNVTSPTINLSISREEFLMERQNLIGHARDPVDLPESTSVVILSKNNGLLLEQLVNNLLKNSAIKEIILVSNNPTNAYALHVVEKIKQIQKCKVVDFKEDFNFSKQCNLGAQHATGEYILFLNDDICPVAENWLNYLLAWMDKPRLVGAMLIYPDQKIQHLGMYLGFNGVAGHSLRFGVVPDSDPNYMISNPRQVSCITGAVMLMPKEVFDDMNGFDPQFATYLQDVDLCLRAADLGLDLVVDPRAILIHMESVTIKPTLNSSSFQSKRFREYSFYQRKWKGKNYLNDDYLSPNIDIADESYKTLRHKRSNS